MRSKRSRQFRKFLSNLPIEIQKQTYAAYILFQSDPYHNSLQFKEVNPSRSLWSARVGIHYRALGIRQSDDEIMWIWIGHHTEYERRIKKL